MDAVNQFCRSTDKFVKGCCDPRPFERLQFIRTTEELYMDLMDPPANMLMFIEQMHILYEN